MTKLNIKRSSDLEIFKAIIEKGLSLPCGWHCEIHLYPNGDIRFSATLSGNTHFILGDSCGPVCVGSVKAANWADWEYRVYSNGQVCHMDLKGKDGRIGQLEAIEAIVDRFYNNNNYIELIRKKWEEMQTKKQKNKKKQTQKKVKTEKWVK